MQQPNKSPVTPTKPTAHRTAYSKYEILESEMFRYMVPAVDALNVGIKCVRKSPDGLKITQEILLFCEKYGLLGFMTTLPTTPDFTNYSAVYLPKNPVIKHETMDKTVFMNLFFPPEREERLKQFRDWASLFCSAYFYYDEQNETMRELHRRSIEAFVEVAPHYTVVLEDDKPQIRWDFHSLLQMIHIMLSFALTDEKQPLRICKECKNRYGVKQNRK